MTLEINLPTTIDGLSARELAILSGQQQEFNGNLLPTLRVNYDDEDKDGNEIPRGQWSITTTHNDQPVTIYAKEVLFRPIFNTLQYSHYDADEQKMVSISVHFQKWGDEVPDTAGGFKCGKVTKKQLEELSDAEKDIQKKIKLARVMFGLVTVSGVDRKGKKVSVEEVPAMFYAKGTHYMPMDDFLSKLNDEHKAMQTVVVKLGLDRKKNGGVTYWEVVPTIVKDVPFTAKDFDTMKAFTDTIRAENEQVLEKWKKARSKGSKPSSERLAEMLGEGNVKDGKRDLELDDEIPFNYGN